MKVNWTVRFRNPVFLFQLLLTALAPALAYTGLSWEELTTWKSVGDLLVQAYTNPALLGLIVVALFNQITDPTTKGVSDSTRSMRYNKPE